MARRSRQAVFGLILSMVVIYFYYRSGSQLGCSSDIQIFTQKSKYKWNEIVTGCGTFLERVRDYNLALNQIRNELVSQGKLKSWNGAKGNSTVEVVWGAQDDFFEKLSKHSNIETVVLPWMGDNSQIRSFQADKSNLLLYHYYEWTGSDQLCKWIEESGAMKLHYDVTFNRTCNRDTNKGLKPKTLEPVFLHMKPVWYGHYWPSNGKSFPPHFFTETTPYTFYLHVVPDAIVTNEGDVYTKTAMIVPFGCSYNLQPKVPVNVESRPVYDELFVITQYWGTATFHRMAEIMPRLGGWIQFLQDNPQIKILAPERNGTRLGDLVEIIGLDSSRLVTDWGRAKIAYVPRGSFCGMMNTQESQIVSSLYQKHVTQVLKPLPRNKLLMIRRSGTRRFTEQLGIESALKKLAPQYGLEFDMYIDNPSPSLTDTMRMFHAAVMVVAPHGAGLGNLYFSQPGTYVVEGLCNHNHVNLCFQRLAVILGHHWHGIPGNGGCEQVIGLAASAIEATTRIYLEQYKQSQGKS